MRITYQLTEKDILESADNKTLRMIGYFLVALGSLSIVTRAISYAPGLAVVAIGLFFAFGTKLQLRIAFRKDKRLQNQFEALIAEDFIQVSNQSATSKYAWDSLTRYTENKNCFLLYQSQRVYNVFPKRAFTAEDLDSFRSLLRHNLGNATAAHSNRIGPRTWVFLAVIAVAAILLAITIDNILHR